MKRYNRIIELYLNNTPEKEIAKELKCSEKVVKNAIEKYSQSFFNQILSLED